MDKEQLDLLQQLLRKALPPIDDTLLRVILLGTVLLAEGDAGNIDEVKSALKQILMEKVDRLQPNGIDE